MKKQILKENAMRVLALVVSMVFMLSSMTVALANDTVTGSFTDNSNQTFTWTLDTTTGALAINGTGAMTYSSSAYPSQDALWGAYKDSIKSVTFGPGITAIGAGLFYGNTSLETVTVPASVTTIAWSAFRGCTALKTVTIDGSTLASIESRAFQRCTSLTSLTLPASVISFDKNTFIPGDTDNVTNIAFTVYSEATKTLILNLYPNASVTVTEDPNVKKSGSFTDKNGVAFTWTLDTTTGALHIDGTGAMTFGSDPGLWTDYKEQIKSVTFGSGITQIGRELFRGFTALTTVTIPGNVTATEWGAFYDCSALTNVTIESGFKSFGDKTFYGCSGLKNITLPDTLEIIALQVFVNSGITELTLPKSLTTIHDKSFGETAGATNVALNVYDKTKAVVLLETLYPDASVTKIENPDSRAEIKASGNFDDEGYGLVWTLYTSGEFVVSRTKDENGDYTGHGIMPTGYYNNPETRPWYNYLSDIKWATFEDGVITISARGLQEATNLIAIEMADTVIEIGSDAFSGCSSLQSLKLSKNLKAIPEGMINSTAVKTLVVPFNAAIESADSLKRTPTDITIYIYKNSAVHRAYPELTITGVRNPDNSTGATRTFTLIDYTLGAYDANTNSTTVTVNTSAETKGTVIFASYDSMNRFTGAKVCPVTLNKKSNTVTAGSDFVPGEGDTVRVFFWYDMETLVPLAEEK